MPPSAFNAIVNVLLPTIPNPGQAVGQVIYQSAKDAITAHAGGGQANAVALTNVINRITVVTTAGDSVRMPKSAAGMMLFISNADSTDSCDVFPAVGDNFNGGTTDAAFALANGKRVLAFCAVAGTWSTILTA